MAGMSILRPEAIAAISTPSSGTGAANLLTASPREVWQTASGVSHSFWIDLGSAISFDTIYLGASDVTAGASWSVYTSVSIGGSTSLVATGAFRLPAASGPRFQSILTTGAAVSARYIQIAISLPTAQAIQIGLLALGKVFTHAYAYGAGRPLIDTARRTDLIDGGFGIEGGVIKSGFRWRFIDLVTSEIDALFSLARDRGNSKPIIVVEDNTATLPPDGSVHYGLFDKFEAFERADAKDTTWALSMTEWR